MVYTETISKFESLRLCVSRLFLCVSICFSQIGFCRPFRTKLNLKTAVQDAKAMQDFDSESLLMGAEHSQKVKAAPIKSDYGLKDPR